MPNIVIAIIVIIKINLLFFIIWITSFSPVPVNSFFLFISKYSQLLIDDSIFHQFRALLILWLIPHPIKHRFHLDISGGEKFRLLWENKTVYSFLYECDTKKLKRFFSRLTFFWIFRSKWVKRNRKSIGQEDRAVQVAQEMVTNVTS